MIPVEGAAGARARIKTAGTETVIETGSHRGVDIVVEVGMGNGATSGGALILHLTTVR
jgi:hypothetical protein